MVKSVLRGAVLLSGLLLVLAGCSDGEADSSASPSPSPSVSESSPTPSPSPTGPVEPVLPEAAKTNDEAGAIAFVKHYWAMVNYAKGTGDTSGLASLAGEECSACRGGEESIRKTYDAGGRIEGGLFTVIRSSVESYRTPGDSQLAYGVTVVTESSPERVIVPDAQDRVYDGGRNTTIFFVYRSDARWVVGDLEAKA